MTPLTSLRTCVRIDVCDGRARRSAARMPARCRVSSASSGLLRTVAPAEFPGVRFHEVAAK